MDIEYVGGLITSFVREDGGLDQVTHIGGRELSSGCHTEPVLQFSPKITVMSHKWPMVRVLTEAWKLFFCFVFVARLTLTLQSYCFFL